MRSSHLMKVPGRDVNMVRVGSYVLLSWSKDSAPVLTEAETAVVLLAMAGRRNNEIASERNVSVRTVANQLASAYRKLGVRSRFDLAAKCRELGQ